MVIDGVQTDPVGELRREKKPDVKRKMYRSEKTHTNGGEKKELEANEVDEI